MALLTEAKEAEFYEPKNFKDDKWVKVMSEEISALHSNNTWDLVTKSHNANIIGSRWIYQIKRNSNWSLDHFKAHLLAQGFNQYEGVDFTYAYSPVIKLMYM